MNRFPASLLSVRPLPTPLGKNTGRGRSLLRGRSRRTAGWGTDWSRAEEGVSTAPQALTAVSSREVTHLVPQFPLWYPGVNFKDSCETEFIGVKHSAQSLADGSCDLSVRAETHTQYKSGRQDRGREGGLPGAPQCSAGCRLCEHR